MLSLTATELPRFMACNGSKFLGGFNPPKEPNSVAEEGNAAHWFVEQVFNNKFSSEELVDRKAPNGYFITKETLEYTTEYLNDILDIRSKGEGFVEIDTSLNPSHEKWEIRGRADFAGYVDKTLYVFDLKYGWRIVEPIENWTLISHAVGFLEFLNIPVEQVVFRIYQPRPEHPLGKVREWKISYSELKDFYTTMETVLTNPKKDVKTGTNCMHCPSLTQCPAAQIAAMNAVDVSYTGFDSELNNDDLGYVLKVLKRSQEVLKQTVEAYEELALYRLKSGGNITGYGIVNKKGNTRWVDSVTPELLEVMLGKDVSIRKLPTPKEIERMGFSKDVISMFTERPDLGYKLVEMDENNLGKKLFGKKGE